MSLTAREVEVLELLRIGKTDPEIGLILGISRLTAKNHTQKIRRKLDRSTRAGAVGKAFDLGILVPGKTHA